MDRPNAPCSIDSAVSLRISAISSSVGGLSWVTPAATRSAPCPTSGAMFRLTPAASVASAQPSSVDHVQGALDLSVAPMAFRSVSTPAAPAGYGV